jgi:hypothetical protein
VAGRVRRLQPLRHVHARVRLLLREGGAYPLEAEPHAVRELVSGRLGVEPPAERRDVAEDAVEGGRRVVDDLDVEPAHLAC